MRARDLAEVVPLVDVDTDALEAATVMASHRLPGLIVTVGDRVPYAILPGSQVVRLIVPPYVKDDPALAHVYAEKASDEIAHQLRGKRIRDLVPAPFIEPVVSGDDHVLEIAELMGRVRSSIVAVVEDGKVIGAVTAAQMLRLGCGAVV